MAFRSLGAAFAGVTKPAQRILGQTARGKACS
jgi:hypothetical protein